MGFITQKVSEILRTNIYRVSCWVDIENLTMFFFSIHKELSNIAVGKQWHLRRTNWCGEAADVLDDDVRELLT